MNTDHAQLVQSWFSAFSFRPKPLGGFWSADAAHVVERLLRGVHPSDLSFQLLESTDWGGRSFLPSMKLATQLHYAPAFLALYITDPRRADFVLEQILDWFTSQHMIFAFSHFDDPEAIVGHVLPSRPLAQRQLDKSSTHPSPGSTLQLRRLRRRIRRTETLAALEQARAWYSEGFRPLSNPYLALLTNDEKHALLQFFSTLEDQKPPPCGSPDATSDRAILAAKAMLTEDRLAKRLGAGTQDECAKLIAVLDVFRRKYQTLFPDSHALPIRAALQRELS